MHVDIKVAFITGILGLLGGCCTAAATLAIPLVQNNLDAGDTKPADALLKAAEILAKSFYDSKSITVATKPVNVLCAQTTVNAITKAAPETDAHRETNLNIPAKTNPPQYKCNGISEIEIIGIRAMRSIGKRYQLALTLRNATATDLTFAIYDNLNVGATHQIADNKGAVAQINANLPSVALTDGLADHGEHLEPHQERNVRLESSHYIADKDATSLELDFHLLLAAGNGKVSKPIVRALHCENILLA